MSEQEIVARTRAFIEQSFLPIRNAPQLDEGFPLFARGVIDSMGAMELVAFLEREYGITVGPQEITEQNIGTLKDIGRFVLSKRPEG